MTPEQWRNNPAAQKKTWIVTGIAGGMLALLWLPSLGSMKRLFTPSPHAPVPGEIAKAMRQPVVPIAKPVAPTAAVPAATPASSFAGKWQGIAMLPPQHGVCKLALEVSANADDSASGYSTLACQPPASDYVSGKASPAPNAVRMAMSINPSSAILAGTADAKGAMHFKVMQNIGVAEANHGCNMLAADAVPFGSGRMAFTWREENCPGGQIILSRTR